MNSVSRKSRVFRWVPAWTVKWIAAACIVAFASDSSAQSRFTVPNLQATADSTLEPTHVVIVQPIICRDDQGKDAARKRIVDKLIDQAYSAAGIDFQFLEPIYYDNTDVRDGSIDVDTIIATATRDGILRSPERAINMFFVSAIDRQPGPLGRSRTPGWQAFVAMGLGGQNPNDYEDALLVAREAGHCLGLVDSAEDPNVSNDAPNLMGEGPLEKRLAPLGLNRHQITTIQQSPLVRPRIECLTLAEGQLAILDDSYGKYFKNLQRREIETLTQSPIQCNELMICQDEARRRFAAAVLPFTEREEEAVTWFAERIEEKIGDDFGLFVKQPWRFIKISNDLAGGFSHTRNACIMFSERTIERIVEARNEPNEITALRTMAPLFVHEQMHVFERFFPQRFEPLFVDHLGFQRATVQSIPWLDERQILNPDAVDMDWVISTSTDSGQAAFYNLRTILRDGPGIPEMGKDFLGVAVRVLPDGDHFKIDVDPAGVPRMVLIENLPEYTARLPVENGLDHPNEIAAYMFQHVLIQDYLATQEDSDEIQSNPIYAKFRLWCRANLN